MRARKKRKFNKFLWFVVVIVLLVLFFMYYHFIYLEDFIPKLEVMEDKVHINSYYIYGTSLSMEGVIDNIDTSYDDLDFVLYNGDFYGYDIEIIKGNNNIKFSFDSDINRGLNLESVKRGKYYLFLRACYENEEGVCDYHYYVLENDTDYDESVYYTMSNQNNKIMIHSSNDYGTMMFDVFANTDDNVYDVVIDPGHGGVDVGAVSSDGKYYEKDLTMDIARLIYDKLTGEGIKVKLTRKEESFGNDEYFEEYNVDGISYVGRAVIPRDVFAKYVFSIHLNSLESSSKTRGLEIYTADKINYDFVSRMVEDILDKTEMVASTKETYKVREGIYTHNFTDSEVMSALSGYDKKGYERYNVTTSSNYLYMIREPGGIITGAYIDDRNSEVGVNPYYDSNVGVESYLLELGYLSNHKDLDYIVYSKEEYANVIADAIIEEVLKNE